MSLAVSIALVCSGSALGQGRPKIAKPVPVPTTRMPTPPPAAIDNSLLIGGDDINARKVESRMTVEVRVNGRGPYHFVVDSGADTSVVGHDIVRDLQLPLTTPVILHGTTGSAVVDRVKVASLSLGTAVFEDMDLPALREADLGGQGMIGIDALVQQRLMMDFEKRVIKAEDARQPARALDGEIIVTARRRRGQLILTEVKAAGLPVEAVIDTGSEITIGNMALRRKLIRNNRDKFFPVTAIGVTGQEMKLEMARIGELDVGSATLRDVPMAFADLAPFTLFGMSDRPAILLGTDLLETFRRVSLDFRARKVRFQLKKCGSSGIIIGTGPAAFSRITTKDRAVCVR